MAIKRETLVSYLKILEDAKVIYKCQRFDLKARRSLRGEEKYYLVDPGIYFAMNTDVRINYGPVSENVLYTYLRSRNYAVSVGRIGKLEVDFITRRRDDYPRYLFTLDTLLQKRDGVTHLNLLAFPGRRGDLIGAAGI